MTQTLGIIGSGHIGTTIARLATRAGIHVVLSNSRGPHTLTALIEELGDRARAATPGEAAEAGDVVVATIPMQAYDRLPRAALAGKTVIDTMNYYPDRDGNIADLDAALVTSSQLVQKHLRESRVVKAFNNIDFNRLLMLARPTAADDRSALPIAGDDQAAKTQVSELLDALGYDTVDLGGLGESWRSEPGTPVYVQPYLPIRPANLSREERMAWLMSTGAVTLPIEAVKTLTTNTVRLAPADASTSLA